MSVYLLKYMQLLNINEASKYAQVSQDTLRRYEKKKLIKPFRTPGNHRRYNKEELDKLFGIKHHNMKNRVFLYCRVSTRKQYQSGNLERQKKRLIDYALKNKYHIVGIYEEIASGINENRKQLSNLLTDLAKKHINYVIIEYKDRFARFGFNYLNQIVELNGAKIIIVEQQATKSLNEEMIEDMISIITSFSAKLYGRRGAKKIKRTLQDLKNE